MSENCAMRSEVIELVSRNGRIGIHGDSLTGRFSTTRTDLNVTQMKVGIFKKRRVRIGHLPLV